MPYIGVIVLGCILERVLNMIPSLAMAYITRGSGNIAPRRLVHSANIAPMLTIHLITGHPNCSNAYGNGASAF